jgi:hypothetical protein
MATKQPASRPARRKPLDAAAPRRPSWLPTEAEVAAHIARQRAEAERHWLRMADGPNSIYADPAEMREAFRARALRVAEERRAAWWVRGWRMLVLALGLGAP